MISTTISTSVEKLLTGPELFTKVSHWREKRERVALSWGAFQWRNHCFLCDAVL